MSVIEIGEAQSFPSVLNVRRGPELRRYVPERTCRRLSDGVIAGCSACDTIVLGPPTWRYCPHCGAKVEE